MVATRRMRRLSRGLPAALALIFALIGATPDPYPAPSVVVYPLTVSGGGDPSGEVGSNIAVLISNKLADLGGLSVKPYVPGTTRAQYLDAAIKEGADYYVTGYLTPVGTDVSMIVQIVSTYSGSVVFSTTAIARTFADAVGQADVVRAAILRHAGRGFAAIEAPAPAASPTTAPIANDGRVNLTKALGRHHRRDAATPAPSASPASGPAASAGSLPAPAASPATAVKPAPAASSASAPSAARVSLITAPHLGNVLVLEAAGSADAATLGYASVALAGAFRSKGIGGGLLPATVEQGIVHAAELCSANAGSRALYAPTVSFGRDPKGGQTVEFDVAVYDCNATLVGSRRVATPVPARGGINSAIDRAAGKLVDGFVKGTR